MLLGSGIKIIVRNILHPLSKIYAIVSVTSGVGIPTFARYTDYNAN